MGDKQHGRINIYIFFSVEIKCAGELKKVFKKLVMFFCKFGGSFSTTRGSFCQI